MQIRYCMLHFILICVLAPWLIGAGYSVCLANFDIAIVAGFAIIVFSLPITLVMAIIILILRHFFDGYVSYIACCSCGLIVGVIIGILLNHIFHDDNHYFVALSGTIGIIVGYAEYHLFRLSNIDQEY